MKKTIFTLFLLLIFVSLLVIRKDDISTFINTYLTPHTVTLGEINDYYRSYDFDFVQNTDNFNPTSKQDIFNIYYTIINAGKSSFTFYCPTEYKDCIKEIISLANNQEELSDINNYVHPFNGFSHIETEYDSLGRVTVNIVRSYTEEDINLIESKIDELLPTLTNNVDVDKKIKNIHDYIINNTKYDSDRSDRKIINYRSDTAYGPLFEGYAICGGYTDLMERLNIKSFKISSNNHVWNAVYHNNDWYHIDLTWDDPVSSDGSNYLEYNYYMIDTNTLLDLETTQHNFNQEHYKELKAK